MGTGSPYRRDQPFELSAFPSKGSVTPVYSRQVFLINYRQSIHGPCHASLHATLGTEARSRLHNRSTSHHHVSAPPRPHPLICTGAEPIHPVHGPPKRRASRSTQWPAQPTSRSIVSTMLRNRIHIFAIFPRFLYISKVFMFWSKGQHFVVPLTLNTHGWTHEYFVAQLHFGLFTHFGSYNALDVEDILRA